MNETLNIEVNGQRVAVCFTALTVKEDGSVVMSGTVQQPQPQLTQAPEPPAAPYTGTVAVANDIDGASGRPRIRSYELHSALVRMYYCGETVTGAVTHCTDRAWRVINMQLGACWIPRNVLRWSEIAGQFCVVESDWEPHWCTPTPELNRYPVLMDADALIPELQLHV